MLEKQIEKAILNYLTTWCGFFAWKNHTTGIYSKERNQFLKSRNKYALKGVSDIIAITHSGKVLFIEVKSKKGRMSKDQKLFEDKVKEYKGHYVVARSVEDVMDYLNEVGV